MAVPMYVLYELGILFAQYVTRNRTAEPSTPETAGSGE
jgi:Sec-independent protein secretion pathway component TatC